MRVFLMHLLILVDLNGKSSNQIFEILEEWNTLLEHSARTRQGYAAEAHHDELLKF
jgi:hypothetical protein